MRQQPCLSIPSLQLQNSQLSQTFLDQSLLASNLMTLNNLPLFLLKLPLGQPFVNIDLARFHCFEMIGWGFKKLVIQDLSLTRVGLFHLIIPSF